MLRVSQLHGFNIFKCNDPLTDQYWSNVVLAMHMDGANDGTTFTDEKGHTVTFAGNVVTKTGNKKFGTASVFFDGTGDYLSVPNSDFDMGSQPFIAETWAYLTAGTSGAIVGNNSTFNSDCSWLVYVSSTGLTLDWIDTSSVYHVVGMLITVPQNTWVHLAVVVEADGNVTGYVNGVSAAGSADITSAIKPPGGPIYIGDVQHTSKKPLNGYLDDLRVTKGIARYTANFTPPCRSFPNS